jgi:hypothetical protein
MEKLVQYAHFRDKIAIYILGYTEIKNIKTKILFEMK